MSFTRKKILIIHSQQPANQYAGGQSGVDDSEQHWMRLLARETYEAVKDTGHDFRLGPKGDSYVDNVIWVQQSGNRDADELWSFHSNATGKVGDHPVGLGIYHAPGSVKGKATAEKLKPFLAKAAVSRAYISTLTVAELTSTTPPAVLIEHEFHDHNGSDPGGADWIRDPENRTAIAQAYKAYVVSRYGTVEGAPVEDRKRVIIVPGSANTSADGLHPKYKRRLDVALVHLSMNPELKIIVTGGLKSGHRKTEAEVAKAYLRDKGLSADRILVENKSGSTLGNFLYGLPIAKKAGFNRLFIISDFSHMRRCLAFAFAARKQLDLDVKIGCVDWFTDSGRQDATVAEAAKQARQLWSGMTKSRVEILDEKWGISTGGNDL